MSRRKWSGVSLTPSWQIFFNWERKCVREASRSCDLHKPAAPHALPLFNIQHLRCGGEGGLGHTPSFYNHKVQPACSWMVLACLSSDVTCSTTGSFEQGWHFWPACTCRFPRALWDLFDCCESSDGLLFSLFDTVRAEWSGQPAWTPAAGTSVWAADEKVKKKISTYTAAIVTFFFCSSSLRIILPLLTRRDQEETSLKQGKQCMMIQWMFIIN